MLAHMENGLRRARLGLVMTGLAIGALAVPGAALADSARTPYFASIRASEARMRTGPGRNYPISWVYRRAGLPVKVVQTYHEWRKVEDPDGTQGWIQGNLLSETRTGYVLGDAAEMREAPRFGARILWRAAPGVVGRISRCARGWCWFDVRGQAGYVEANRLWGTMPDEVTN